MARPNSTPIRMIGRKLSTAPGFSTPNTLPSQPHWYTATTPPKAAASESRKPPVASSGTTMERNTSSSRISESPTTIARYGGRASPSLVDTSTFPAVWPVRPMLTPVESLIWPFSARSSETTLTVLALAGPAVGQCKPQLAGRQGHDAQQQDAGEQRQDRMPGDEATPAAGAAAFVAG